MVAISTLIAAASVAAGLGSAAKASLDAKKARKQQEANLAKQETKAKEAAALNLARDDTGADVLLGTEDPTTTVGATSTSTATTKKSRAAAPLGGVSAAAKVGL